MRRKIFRLYNMRMTAFAGALLAALFLSNTAWSQENQVRFVTSGSVNWLQKEMNAQVSFDLAQAGIKLPAGRLMGEETLSEAYPRLLRPHILSIKLDSGSLVRNLVDNGEISLEDIDRISLEAVEATSLSADLSQMIGRYTISVGRISSLLIKHRGALEPPRPLIPVQTADYTGIIIIATEELPVRGRRAQALAEPCLFPKIWDTGMNLIYERNMFESRDNPMIRYALEENIFRPTPSGLDGELALMAGSNPLRILAREVYGIYPTDLVIDQSDALKILSSENNRRLLREGRVILVLNNAQLQRNIIAP